MVTREAVSRAAYLSTVLALPFLTCSLGFANPNAIGEKPFEHLSVDDFIDIPPEDRHRSACLAIKFRMQSSLYNAQFNVSNAQEALRLIPPKVEFKQKELQEAQAKAEKIAAYKNTVSQNPTTSALLLREVESELKGGQEQIKRLQDEIKGEDTVVHICLERDWFSTGGRQKSCSPRALTLKKAQDWLAGAQREEAELKAEVEKLESSCPAN